MMWFKKKVMFHITPAKNLDKIIGVGLLPYCKHHCKGISTYVIDDFHYRSVWLTDDVDFIKNEHCGQEWVKSRNPVCLRVNVKGLTLIPFGQHEWFTEDFIGPERLERIN